MFDCARKGWNCSATGNVIGWGGLAQSSGWVCSCVRGAGWGARGRGGTHSVIAARGLCCFCSTGVVSGDTNAVVVGLGVVAIACPKMHLNRLCVLSLVHKAPHVQAFL